MADVAVLAVDALQALAAADVDALERLYAPDFVFHDKLPGHPDGHQGLRHRAMLLSSSLYDPKLNVDLVVADGDKVAVRWRGRAVHKGDLVGVAPTGVQVEVAGITIFRFVDDRVSEEWTEFDGLSLARQLHTDRSKPADRTSTREHHH